MITFSIALVALIVGYFIYGKVVDRILGFDYSKPTPAVDRPDGVDFIPLPTWKVFMIQFLNIAGLGPIFGAIMGAKFGTASYLWIVFGTIFAGAVHDFISGMMSLANEGETLPDIIGRFLGRKVRSVFVFFVVVTMILVGVVFVSGPAELIAAMTPGWADSVFWVCVIFVYYFLATMMPIDAIIGKIYPLFAFALLFMAVGILIMLFVNWPDLPEIWTGLGTNYESNPIFPMMFVSIACGAISGFHATQSPLMARCLVNPHHGRPVFYGAMVTEGIVALVWAAAATAFFSENGIFDAVGGHEFSGAGVATAISREWLGAAGGILTMIGIVVAPISSGDTALRSARIIIADSLKYRQDIVRARLLVSLPIFAVAIIVLLYSLVFSDGFSVIWRYFAWCNQTMSVFTLWAITVFLALRKRLFVITLVPALWMTSVCTTYVLVAPECLHLLPDSEWFAISAGAASAVLAFTLFMVWYRKMRKALS